ncbi:thermonuclease family protein [Mesorhizobium sp. CAU 1741]|uniref:thermonuclease family protein n=1 Tax=Mesorhizobium sp. CAU 1741 TaxID=3140366 RepID=UPI00325C2917
MRPFVLAVAAGGLSLAVVGLNLAAGSILVPAPEPSLPAPQTDVAMPESVVPEEQAVAPAPPSLIRPVAPDIVAVPNVDRQSLERVEQRQPLSPIGLAEDPTKGPPREEILHRPVATAAGAFEAMGYRVALEGIDVTAADEVCGPEEWPCGVHARTAFRNWLRGRALTCVVPRVAPDDVVVAKCARAAQDPAEWLVSQGWARATAAGPYAEIGSQARADRRGLFGPAPAAPAPPPSSGGEFAPQGLVDERAGVVDPVERSE